jgi:outer membrane protein OmpA-like peptidoglycan-associated protein
VTKRARPHDGRRRAAIAPRRAALAIALCLGVALPASGLAEAAGDCATIAVSVAEARKAGDFDALDRLVAQADTAASACSAQARACLGRDAALGLLDAAKAKASEGASAGEVAALITRGRRLASPWQLLAAHGDLLLDEAKAVHDAKAYGEASLTYQLALLDAETTPVSCSNAEASARPAKPALEKLYGKMSTALLLAAPVRVATSRCGACDWLFLAGVGDFTPASRPLPITFDEGGVKPTPQGAEAIAALLQCTKGAGWKRIVLSGHTDDIGPEADNMKLSGRRLDVVKQALVAGGFDGEVVLEPKGKSEAYPVDPADQYTAEEVRRLNRRIELRETVAGADCK